MNLKAKNGLTLLLILTNIALTSCVTSTPTPHRNTSSNTKPTITQSHPTSIKTNPTATRPLVVEACLNSTALNVRAGPSKEFPIIGGLFQGDCVEIDGVGPNGIWGRTRSQDWNQDVPGWVALSFFEIHGDIGILLPKGVEPTPILTKRAAASTSTPWPTRKPTTTKSCSSSYPTVCLPDPPPDLDCSDIPYINFPVKGSDPHRLDGDYDGIACEPPPTPVEVPSSSNCSPCYSVCIPPPPPDLDCGQISVCQFRVLGCDPHGFDGDGDGIGCEWCN